MDLSKVIQAAGVCTKQAHPTHADHVGYSLQVKVNDKWEWWDGGDFDPYEFFESALTSIKEKKLDYQDVEFRIVATMEVK